MFGHFLQNQKVFFSTKLSGTFSTGSSLAGTYIFLWPMVQGCLSHNTFIMQNGQWCVGALSYTEEAEDPDTHAGLMELWETLHSSNDEISWLHFTFFKYCEEKIHYIKINKRIG